MAPKIILVPFISDAASGAALDLACIAATFFDAHVDVLHLKPDARTMIPYVGEGMSGALVEDVIASAEREAVDRSAQARSLFAGHLARYGLTESERRGTAGPTASWREETGREDELVAIAGRTADLVAVSRPGSEVDGPPSTLFETALFETGQALLVAPPVPISGFGERILIAWNGSPEAAGAVTAAIPFLARARSVSVLAVAGWSEGPRSAEALVRRLDWHGIAADLEVLSDYAGTIGETVIASAARREADMIVMGAYTQSRLRQMILGGVTRHVLATAQIPLLMSH
ncbi:MAG: universal stress protein [Alphaproteobacteria bacterium]